MIEELTKTVRELTGSLFYWRKKIMDWGLASGLAAICGVVVNFIRIGRWQGNIETRVQQIEQTFDKQDARLEGLTNSINEQNKILTKIEVKLDLIFGEKKGRKKNA